ncbi:MAG: reactive intermediate/imine deaminase [Deltaproteobacteria bacterium]|nr:reactive intermediate/imine deaminase [Deltaproteobacteria bacterium]
MDKHCIETPRAPAAIGPYSQGIRIGQLVFVSGQIPLRPETGELLTDIKDATRQCLDNVKAILEVGGANMDAIVKVTVFMCNMGDFAAMNEVYRIYFPKNPPARVAVQVVKLPREAIIEIEAVAVVP